MEVESEVRQSGFCVVRGVVPRELVDSARSAVLERFGGDLLKSHTWGPMAEQCSRGFAPIWNDRHLWNIRQHPPVYQIFAGLLQSSDLWVSMDRCHFKPPLGAVGVNSESALAHFGHWDEPTERWPFVRFQGVLALVDTDPNMGAFVCSPDLYKTYVHLGRSAARERLAGGDFNLWNVGCRAGDLIVWDRRLFHGNGPNLSTSPRVAFYITMFPAGTEAERAARIRSWRSGEWLYGPTSDKGFSRPDITRSPKLTELGKKLLGFGPGAPR